MSGVLTMKRRVLCLVVTISVMIFITWFFNLYLFNAILLCAIACVILSTFQEKYGKITAQWKKVPDLLNDFTRNYKVIYLGYQSLGSDGLDLTQKYSNLYSDYLMLQRYYSLGCDNCRFIINTRSNKEYQYSCKPSLFSLNMLHPITILEHNVLLYKYAIEWGEFLTPMLFYLKCFFNCINRNIHSDIIYCNYELFKEILCFSKERGLRVEVYIEGCLLEYLQE